MKLNVEVALQGKLQQAIRRRAGHSRVPSQVLQVVKPQAQCLLQRQMHRQLNMASMAHLAVKIRNLLLKRRLRERQCSQVNMGPRQLIRRSQRREAQIPHQNAFPNEMIDDL